MARPENTIITIGRFTKDPELKPAGEGKVVNFNLAINKYVKGSDHPEADYPSYVAWNTNAEFISKYFKKGDKIAIIGELRTRNYEAADGSKRQAVEILVDRASFVESKGNGGGSNESNSGGDSGNTYDNNEVSGEEITDDNELPF